MELKKRFLEKTIHILITRKSSLNYLKHLRYFRILSNLFQLVGFATFLIIFEFSFFLLLPRIGYEFYEIWLLQFYVASFSIIVIYCTFNLNKSNILKFFKFITSLLMLLLISMLFIIVVIWFDSLITLKLILGSFTTYYLIKTIHLLKRNKIRSSAIKLKTLAIISLVFFSFNGIFFFISLAPCYIEIQPKTEPEIIFWVGSNQLPDEPENLEICKEYNIAFMPTIREKDVGNSEFMELYKTLIANEINLYFTIGGNSEFFAHIDNAKEFPLIYKNIRQWFINESILESPYITSFSIDAEPPDEFIDSIKEKELIDTLDYGYKNYPTKGEIKKATEALKEFKDLIKEDGKKCGMIQGSQMLDSADQDGDLSLFLRNVQSLSIKWDFKITMLYRTNRFQIDESDDDPPEFFSKSVSVFYGALIEGTKFTTSELSFYQNVALQENSEDNLAKEQYIFIGNFKKEFKDTKYIKDKQFYTDFDICRHFKNEKIFFYDLKGFLSHYGWEGIKKLGKYAEQKEKSYLKYIIYKSLVFITFYCGLIIIDIIASLEGDLA